MFVRTYARTSSGLPAEGQKAKKVRYHRAGVPALLMCEARMKSSLYEAPGEVKRDGSGTGHQPAPVLHFPDIVEPPRRRR